MPALHVGALNETVLQAVSEVDLNEKCTEQECSLWPKGLSQHHQKVSFSGMFRAASTLSSTLKS